MKSTQENPAITQFARAYTEEHGGSFFDNLHHAQRAFEQSPAESLKPEHTQKTSGAMPSLHELQDLDDLLTRINEWDFEGHRPRIKGIVEKILMKIEQGFYLKPRISTKTYELLNKLQASEQQGNPIVNAGVYELAVKLQEFDPTELYEQQGALEDIVGALRYNPEARCAVWQSKKADDWSVTQDELLCNLEMAMDTLYQLRDV
ncbi:MAG: hypothetical protein AAGJ35_10480 [Myxococcota bacterium]